MFTFAATTGGLRRQGYSFLKAVRLFVFATVTCAKAVLITDTIYQTSAPSGSDIANWTIGWGETGITGWDYVGTVNGSSAVYLGNGWVITAAHVGVGGFTLGGVTYDVLAGSTVTFGSADLVMFQISTSPTLPALSISSTAPVSLSSQVVMIGYGDGSSSTILETWGVNTVTATGQSINVTVGSTVFTTTTFVTEYGTNTYRQGRSNITITNTAEAVANDSGGAIFVYTGSSWQLAGIMEAVASDGTTYIVQLSNYLATINGAMVSVPEPSSSMLLILCAPTLFLLIRNRRSPRTANASLPGTTPQAGQLDELPKRRWQRTT